MVTIYTYNKCATCRKALAFLDENNISYDNIAIRQTPPDVELLEKMLAYMENNLKKLFNTSGQDYRSLNMKDKIDKITNKEAFELLNSCGNLVKRPFLITDDGGMVGFNLERYKEFFEL